MRITLDTNVLIAAFVFRGLCHDLFAYCGQRHELITSQFILDELRAKLLGKYKQRIEAVEGTIAVVLSRSRVVEPVPLPQRACRDPDDDWVLGTAVAGGSDCLVTGDRALLELISYQ